MNDVIPSNPISRDIIFGIKIISVCFDMFYIFFRQNLTIFQQFCVTLPEPRSSALSIDAMLQYRTTVHVYCTCSIILCRPVTSRTIGIGTCCTRPSYRPACCGEPCRRYRVRTVTSHDNTGVFRDGWVGGSS